MPSQAKTKIIPITSPRHIPALAHIKQLAFMPSPMSHAMYPRDATLIEEWFVARENVAMGDAKQRFWAVVREVDERDGDEGSFIDVDAEVDGEGRKYVVLAWAKWTNLVQGQGQGEGMVNGVGSDDGAAAKAEEAQRLWTSPDALPKGSHVELVRAFKSKLKEMKAKWIDEEKDCVLDLLCTNPLYERQGHGRALLKHGLDIADASGMRVYLEATSVGLPLYERLGWKTLGRMEWVLSEFGVEGEGDEDGKLVLTGMIREPAERV